MTAEPVVYDNKAWAKAIRERDGRKCVKCGYHHASVYAIAGGHVLCNACADEWEVLQRSGRCPVTDTEWMKLPSLLQFIAAHRKRGDA